MDITVTIDDAQKKALEWDIVNLNSWANNAVYNKARRCIDQICTLALEDKTHTILSLSNKQLLRQYLENQGIYLTSVQQLPDNIKREIVLRTNIQSAAERDAD